MIGAGAGRPASWAGRIAVVVAAPPGRSPVTAPIPATMARIPGGPGRRSGSPPVSSSRPGRRAIPSAGMRGPRRRVHRPVGLTPGCRATRPWAPASGSHGAVPASGEAMAQAHAGSSRPASTHAGCRGDRRPARATARTPRGRYRASSTPSAAAAAAVVAEAAVGA